MLKVYFFVVSFFLFWVCVLTIKGFSFFFSSHSLRGNSRPFAFTLIPCLANQHHSPPFPLPLFRYSPFLSSLPLFLLFTSLYFHFNFLGDCSFYISLIYLLLLSFLPSFLPSFLLHAFTSTSSRFFSFFPF